MLLLCAWFRVLPTVRIISVPFEGVANCENDTVPVEMLEKDICIPVQVIANCENDICTF
jgi:hypothetical protein